MICYRLFSVLNWTGWRYFICFVYTCNMICTAILLLSTQYSVTYANSSWSCDCPIYGVRLRREALIRAGMQIVESGPSLQSNMLQAFGIGQRRNLFIEHWWAWYIYLSEMTDWLLLMIVLLTSIAELALYCFAYFYWLLSHSVTGFRHPALFYFVMLLIITHWASRYAHPP